MVLIEGISVVVREADINTRYDGGRDRFLSDAPNRTWCADGELVRIGFMTPADVQAYVRVLEKRGLRFMGNGRAVDIAVVDQLRGLTVPCDWIETRNVETDGGVVKACGLKGSQSKTLSVPSGWRFEGSLSQTSGFVPGGATGKSLEYLRHEDGLDVFRSRLTGEEVYVGRAGSEPVPEPKDEAFVQIESIASRALELDAQADEARSSRDEEQAARVYSELVESLLPRAEAMAENAATHVAFAHYAHGLVLRVLKEHEQAVECFQRSLAHQPDAVNTLLEITLCLGTLGRSREAWPYARRAVDVVPRSAAAWGNLAMCLIQEGNKAEAKLAIDKAVSLDPADAKNRYIATNFERYFS